MNQTIDLNNPFSEMKIKTVPAKRCIECLLYPGCIVIKNELKMVSETNNVTDFFVLEDAIEFIHGIARICKGYKYVGDYVGGTK